MIIAINQPYFSPYATYYALIRSADIFVLFDCVQFQRRGRIHRSQIHKSNLFKDGWLTLPIEKMPQQTPINKIAVRPWKNSLDKRLIEHLEEDFDLSLYMNEKCSLIDFLENHHRAALQRLQINTKIVRSSTLNIPQNLTGQARILEICNRLKATHYINLPGGCELYDASNFAQHNINLSFISADNISRHGYLQSRAEGTFSEFFDESNIARFEV